MYLKHWLAERQEQLCKPSPVKIEKVHDILPYQDLSELFQVVEDEYGLEARLHLVHDLVGECSELSKSYVIQAIKSVEFEDYLNYIHSYVTHSVDGEDLRKSLTSQFQISLADKEIKKSWCAMMIRLGTLCEADLKKAVKPEEWERITDSEVPTKNRAVDHTHHTDVSKIHKDYRNLLNSEFEIQGEYGRGQAPKMVHSVGDDTFMTKAYHKQPGYGIRGFAPHPINGWAAMAMKHLYHAGKIGHLAEDVHSHVYKDTPITVHKFEPDSMTAGDFKGPDDSHIDRLSLAQIAAMDFLSHNTDRHEDNLVLSKDPKAAKGKYHKITAIDHETAFQYTSGLNREDDLGYFASVGKATNPKWYNPKSDSLDFKNMPEFHDWWKENNHGIRSEMEKQLLAIKNPIIREHVRRNFNHRAEALDALVNNGEMRATKLLKIPQPEDHVKELLSKLPQDDPKEALNILMAAANNTKDISHEQVMTIGGAVKSLIESASPETLTEIYKHVVGNPKFNTETVRGNPGLNPAQLIKEHLATPERYVGDKPVYKEKHIKHFMSMADEMTGPNKYPLYLWKQRYSKLLSQGAQ